MSALRPARPALPAVHVPSQRRPRGTEQAPGAVAVPSSRPADDRAPWVTVLVLAVPLAVASTFWTVALRTSVGSISRTGAPFASWVRESVLVLPWHVAGVLAALVLARRWCGPRPDRLRSALVCACVVALVATLVGLGQLGASAAQDLRLQLGGSAGMTGMVLDCADDCVASVRGATWALQGRAVLVGTGVLLLPTNLALTVWVLAVTGGRLPLTARPGTTSVRAGSRRRPAEVAVIASLIGAGAVHASVVREHLHEWPAAGAFFVVLSLGEVLLATALLRFGTSSTPAVLGCLLLSLGPVCLWAVSRTVGLPVGPEPGVPEAVGTADLAACALELLTVVAVVALGRAPRRGARHRIDLGRTAVAVVAGLAAAGLAGGMPGIG